jgi:molybdopterin-binding protein
MRVSARNQVKGTIKEVKKGATTAHVLIDIGDIDIGGPLITSSITNESVDRLWPQGGRQRVRSREGVGRYDRGRLIPTSEGRFSWRPLSFRMSPIGRTRTGPSALHRSLCACCELPIGHVRSNPRQRFQRGL